jgi:hypothetical protein
MGEIYRAEQKFTLSEAANEVRENLEVAGYRTFSQFEIVLMAIPLRAT